LIGIDSHYPYQTEIRASSYAVFGLEGSSRRR
jgi:hypothetical protein